MAVPALYSWYTMGVSSVPVALRVLVVDDEATTLVLTKAILERAGYEVMTRARGLGTTPQILADKPDIVLLDLSMPGIDGAEIARTVRARAPEVLVILHSARERSELDALARQSGAHGAIPKGLTPSAFVTAFQALALRAPGSSRPPRS